MPYKNNFELREERYYNSKKAYSGVALDDLRGGLKLAEKMLSESKQERYQLVYNFVDETLDAQARCLHRLSSAVMNSLCESYHVASNKIRFVEVDLEECFTCELLKFKLTRPPHEKGNTSWVADTVRLGITSHSNSDGDDSSSSSDDEIDTKKRTKNQDQLSNKHNKNEKRSRTKLNAALDSSSDSDEGKESEEEGSINHIKMMAGKNPEKLAAQYEAVQEEESRTVRHQKIYQKDLDKHDDDDDDDDDDEEDIFFDGDDHDAADVNSNPTVSSSSSLLIDHYECGLKQESLEQYESAILHYKKFLSSLSRVSNRDTIKRCVTLRRIGVCSSYLMEESTGGGGVSLSSSSSSSSSSLPMKELAVNSDSPPEEVEGGRRSGLHLLNKLGKHRFTEVKKLIAGYANIHFGQRLERLRDAARCLHVIE
jgi:hypothetical protein